MTLPAHSAAWMRELLGADLPEEQTATCDACVMCASPGERPPPGTVAFNPRTKCCTYLPTIHNFLVGRILGDPDPALAKGRASIEKRLDAGAAVTPLGLGKTRAFQLVYTHGRESTFGRSAALLCPHYVDEKGGLCGIWKHREATCATWYCKHDRGAAGEALWERVQELIGEAERELARFCVVELDPGPQALEELFPLRVPLLDSLREIDPHELDGVVSPERRERVWGRYAGREREFYRACAKLAGSMSWKDVLARSGPEVHAQARLTREAFERYSSRKMPRRLRMAPYRVEVSAPDTARLTTYSTYDAIEIPRALADALPRFDGRPVKDVLEEAREAGVAIDRELVRTLVDFNVLEEPTAPRRPTS